MERNKEFGKQILSKKTRVRIISVILSMVMAVALVMIPAPIKEVQAAGFYSSYIPKASDDSNALDNKAIVFGGFAWYIIEDNSTAANSGTVTLLCRQWVYGNDKPCWDLNNSPYKGSIIENTLNDWNKVGGSLYSVQSAIVGMDLSDVGVQGAKLWLLSEEEASSLPLEVRKGFDWWTRTEDSEGHPRIVDSDGSFYSGNSKAYGQHYLRPACKIDLSKVDFTYNNAGQKLFKLKSDKVISKIDATIELPSVGTKIAQETEPTISLGNNSLCNVDFTCFIDGYPSVNPDYDNGSIFGTTIEAGKDYYVEMYLRPAAEDVSFAVGEAIELTVNGGSEYELGYCSKDAIMIYCKLTAPSEKSKTYTVSFETNGGSKVASQTVEEGGKAAKPDDPTKDGNTFGGWYADSALTKIFDFGTAITADTKVYAKWTENEKEEEKEEDKKEEKNEEKTAEEETPDDSKMTPADDTTPAADNSDTDSEEAAGSDDKKGSDNSGKSNSDSSSSKKQTYSNEWVDGKWYSSDGSQTYAFSGGWIEDSVGWWFVDERGWYPTDQWMKIDGKWYYFDSIGYMVTNQYAGGWTDYTDGYWWVGEDGAWDGSPCAVWVMTDGRWWFQSASGWFPTNSWYMIGGTWYYFDGEGWMTDKE